MNVFYHPCIIAEFNNSRIRILGKPITQHIEWIKIGIYMFFPIFQGIRIPVLILLIISCSPMLLVAEQCPKYNRSEYGGWIDIDGDCQRTRSEVLIEESKTSVSFKTNRNCKVISGRWEDPFSGRTFTDPLMLDIDHVVPLREAHQSGAWKWPQDKKQQYANFLADRNHLMAVHLSANRSKGYKDPAEWLPPNESFIKEYARIWIQIKNEWGLTADQAELDALKRILGDEAGIEYPVLAEECIEGGRNPFAAPTSIATDPPVKKSKSGICHDKSSRSYIRTKSFIPFDTIEECLESGGRLPKS